ncbi:hypothetical protein [Bradyrhizobium sp. SRS-191]|uniref:hypothetical protein n=1 Tax=Bradyrhizobium sp. SRS-191 TaxID=2962606 RepID=UPI00211E5A5D|nr:hypothetical protein [Bradyrhizobium sp. SRS-191]
MTIKHIIPGSFVALALLTGAAMAGELPSYAVGALPATPHQLTVVGASSATEQTVAINADSSASPHQLAVLAQHRRSAALVVPTTVGSARN